MVTSRRKRATYSKRKRDRMKVERDQLNLEYLRCVRDVAKSEMRQPATPLSVYSSSSFPLSFQFKEAIGTDGRVKYSYNTLPMPSWNDLNIDTKVSLFQMFSEEWPECLYAFHIKIHHDLHHSLGDAGLVKMINKRIKSKLSSLGELPRHYFFVVETHDRDGKEVLPHLHGVAMVEDEKQALAVKKAIAEAAGQGSGGRPKLHKGSKGEFCYFEPGKSFPRYMLKQKAKGAKAFGRKPYVFSRKANQVTRDFYEFITVG